MGIKTHIFRFLVSNILTIFYSVCALFTFAFAYAKNPFKDPWAQKLRLEPPVALKDAKYGVHKYIKANNIKLHYVENGDPSKPLMLFVHGFPEFWYSWRHQIVEFSKDYWCVAVDLRGYGDSERPEQSSDYKIDILIEDLRDLIRQLGRDKCIVVAHDWGGLIACRLRDVHPDVFSGLIALSSTSREAWLGELWDSTKQLLMSWYVFLFRAPIIPELSMQMNNMDFLEKSMLNAGNDHITKEDIDCYKYWFSKQFAFTPPLNYYRENYLYEVPKKIKCERNIPFLLANGEHDLYISKDILKRMKEEYAYIDTMIVDGCGHFLQQSNPEKTNSIMREFLVKHKL